MMEAIDVSLGGQPNLRAFITNSGRDKTCTNVERLHDKIGILRRLRSLALKEHLLTTKSSRKTDSLRKDLKLDLSSGFPGTLILSDSLPALPALPAGRAAYKKGLLCLLAFPSSLFSEVYLQGTQMQERLAEEITCT